jgi:hypothetical protein
LGIPITRTKQWGIAWVALTVALGLHVADEAITDFLPLYNSIAGTIRETYRWIPLPTFSFSVWLKGLIAGILFLLSLSPFVFAGNLIFRPISYFLGVLMTLNALTHIGGSIYLGELAPGALSSPFLLISAIALLVTTRRVRHELGVAGTGV